MTTSLGRSAPETVPEPRTFAFRLEPATVAQMKRFGSWCAPWLLAACVNTPPSDGAVTPLTKPDASPLQEAPIAVPLGDAGRSCGTPCDSGQPGNLEAGVGAAGRGAGAAPMTKPVEATGDANDMDDAGTVPTTTPDSGVGPNGRPIGVDECYTAESRAHPATERHWEVFRGGDLAARNDMIGALSAAVTAAPNEQELALLLGLASLWRVAEPYGLESFDPILTLESIEAAQRELERAYVMCPTDHRIPAWLGPIKIRMGRMLEDAALVDEGFAVLNEGIEHYPGFVLFAKLLVYADLPASDPDFTNALDAVRENSVYCGTVATGLSSDPACHNHPRAAHNIEGSAVFLGDMYAKAQDRDAALAAYESAKKVPTWESWPYRELLEERITKLDARIAALASPSTADDLEAAWTSQIQCSLCHRD